jgi:hypothetical protein
LRIRLFNLSFVIVLHIALGGALLPAQSAPQAASPSKAQPQPGDRIVLSVGDQKMSAAEVEKFVQTLSPQLRAYFGGQGKAALPEQLVRMKVLLEEALKQKLEEQPDVVYALRADRESILADAALMRLERNIPITDEELHSLYKQRQEQLEQIRIRLLLIRTDSSPMKKPGPDRPLLSNAEARKKLEDLRKQILAGAEFAELAKQYSEDSGTASAGGDMGYTMRDQLMPPLGAAAAALKPGQVSDVLLTPMGLEIIKVEDKRTRPFEEVKPQLETELRQSKAKEALGKITEQYKVVIDQQFFSGSEPAGKAQTSPPHR